MKSLLLLWALLFGACYMPLSAQTPDSTLTQEQRIARFRVSAVRAQQAVKLDGVLDEPEWQQAVPARDFRQFFPYDTSKAFSPMEVSVLYDDEFVYFGAVMYDTIQKPFVASSLRRDFEGPLNDNIAILIDPYNDQTNGYMFSVTPYGVQREGLIANGFGLSVDWDNRWYAEVTRHKGYWVAEIAIPFKTLRFTENAKFWRVQFTRQELKLNELAVWAPVPRMYSPRGLMFGGALEWPEPPKPPKSNIAIIPYALGALSKDYRAGTPVEYARQFGGDAKVALTSALNLDLTVNPDFAQAEVDRQQINLSQYDLFFPERRQFFLENSDLFGTFGFSTIRPFFSRRIGLGIPIVAGARVSGKIGNQWRVGAMNVQTEGKAEIQRLAQNYTVAAVQRMVFGSSSIGAIMVNRQAYDNGFLKSDFNRVLGLDFNLQSPDGRWKGKTFYHQSITPGAEKQQHAHATFLRYEVQRFFAEWNHEIVGENYSPEVGFVPRTRLRDPRSGEIIRQGFTRFEPNAGLRFYPKKGKINNYVLALYGNSYINREGKSLEQTIAPFMEVYFQSGAFFYFEYYRDQYRVVVPFQLGLDRDTLIMPANFLTHGFNAQFESNKRKPFSFVAYGGIRSYFGGQRHRVGGSITYRFQPYLRLTTQAEHVDIQIPEGRGKITLVSQEIELTLTRNLYINSFLQYNTSIQNLSLNTRFQWRFRPMSDLFIVYNDSYDNLLNVRSRGLIVKIVYWLQV